MEELWKGSWKWDQDLKDKDELEMGEEERRVLVETQSGVGANDPGPDMRQRKARGLL